MLFAALLLVHLVCFAAYLCAGFAQLQLMKRSRRPGLAPAVRDHLEGLSAEIITKFEVPAIMGSILSGLTFVSQTPELMKQGWLHGKLLCVVILLVLSHLEMFNARRIVRARAADGEKASDVIEARKKRHELLGLIGTLAAVALLVMVTFVRLRG